jgi:hypothetical protein
MNQDKAKWQGYNAFGKLAPPPSPLLAMQTKILLATERRKSMREENEVVILTVLAGCKFQR